MDTVLAVFQQSLEEPLSEAVGLAVGCMSGCNCIDKVIRDWQKRTKNIYPFWWRRSSNTIHDESQVYPTKWTLKTGHSGGFEPRGP